MPARRVKAGRAGRAGRARKARRTKMGYSQRRWRRRSSARLRPGTLRSKAPGPKYPAWRWLWSVERRAWSVECLKKIWKQLKLIFFVCMSILICNLLMKVSKRYNSIGLMPVIYVWRRFSLLTIIAFESIGFKVFAIKTNQTISPKRNTHFYRQYIFLLTSILKTVSIFMSRF